MTSAETTTTLLLVRHGATRWSEMGRLNGWTDVPLSELGLRQAAELARTIDVPAGATIWSSDLERAAATAATLRAAAGEPESIHLRHDERLRELDFGELEGHTWSALEPATRRALVDFDGFVAPGGESVSALAARVDDFLGRLREDSGPHVLVTHGGVIRLLLRRGPGDRSVQTGEAVQLSLAGGIVGAG